MKKDTTAKLAHVEAAMRRWHTRLTRASNMLQKLERQRRRLQLQQQVGVGRPKETTPKASSIDVDEVRRQVDAAIDAPIPAFLKCDPNAEALKKMNERIEKRAADRSKKPAKEKPPGRILAKAMAERDALRK